MVAGYISKKLEHGQASVEMIGAVMILLVVFAAVLGLYSQRSSISRLLVESFDYAVECEKIASSITQMNQTKAASQAVYDIRFGFTLKNGDIKVGNELCRYFGKVKDENIGVSLPAGKYRLVKGIIGVEFYAA